MNRTALPPRLAKRRGARKPRLDAETVFKTFVRTLERLREAPRGGSAFDATREKA
jgi:hypothetical protein